MNSHYKIGSGALLLAVLAGISGGIAALFFQISSGLSVSNSFIHSDFMQNLSQTHARMMIFFVLQPVLIIGFGSYFVPILIAAKDMAFRLVNYLSLLCLSVGFIFNFLTFFQPNAAVFTLYGLGFWSIASVLFSINMIVTILNNRSAEMGFSSLPLFVWGQGISAVLLLPTASVLLAALTRDYFDYPLQLSWAIQQTVQTFMYPIIMMMIVPAFGIVLHIISTILNRPIPYSRGLIVIVALITSCIFLFWNKMIFDYSLWVSNQYAVVSSIFSYSLYGLTLCLLGYCARMVFFGERRYPTPVLWSFGFMILIGLAWPYKGIVSQVGDVHSCISYGLLFASFAGFYFWMGKLLGKQYSERLGKLHFAITSVGVVFTLNIFPIGAGSFLIGSALMGLSILVFVIMLIHAFKSKMTLPENYWGEGAVTYEWQRPSPVFIRSK